jgi:hypothetical protein
MTNYQTERVVPCRRDGPPVDVITWRRCRLLEAGFPHDLAEMLAGTEVRRRAWARREVSPDDVRTRA